MIFHAWSVAQMSWLTRILHTRCLGLVAVALLGVFPESVAAAGMGFRNDLNTPIVVQGTTIIKGKPFFSKPLLIQPGKSAWHVDLMKGDREVVIFLYDMQTKKLIQTDRQLLPYMGGDLFFSVQTLPSPNPNAPPKTMLKPAPIPFGEMAK
jgi:hypothetical protein